MRRTRAIANINPYLTTKPAVKGMLLSIYPKLIKPNKILRGFLKVLYCWVAFLKTELVTTTWNLVATYIWLKGFALSYSNGLRTNFFKLTLVDKTLTYPRLLKLL